MGKMKILLVDDKAENLHLLETFLQRNGCTTVIAANGAEALANALKSPPDMVVSDILMPVMDGFVLCREWKKNKILQKIPFVFYTATYTDPKDEEFALSLGADRFIVKPQDLNDFFQVIKETYNTYRMKTAQPMPAPAPEEKVFLKEYNEVLVRKLEDKMLQVEAAEKELKKKNAALEKDIEEFKRSEEKILESEERYRLLVETLPDGVIVHSQGRVVFANPASATIIGAASPVDLTGKPIIEFVHPDYRELVLKRIQQSLSESAIVPLAEEKFVRLDGTLIDVEVRAIPFSYAGKPAMLTVFNDITDRLRAEQQIALLAHTLKSVAECVSITDTNDSVLFANNAFLKTYGYREEEILGKNVNAVRSPNNSPETARGILAATLAGGWSGELLNRTKDGRDFMVSLSTSCVRDEDGHVIALVGVAEDITEQRAAQDRLRQSEEHLRSILENVRDAIFTISPLGIFTSISPAFQQITGFSVDEWIGNSFTDLVHPDDLQRARDLFMRVLAGDTLPVFELRIRTKHGSFIIGEFLSSPQRRNDSIIGVLTIGRDITERKLAEGEKKSLEAQLRRAQKLESIGTLASGIAHDFNNILGIILGYSSLLEHIREDPQRHSESVTAITKATQRGASLVKQLLIFARKTEALFETVSINDMIEEISKLLHETFPKTIKISTSLQQDLPTIVADASQIHQVLLNLCVNARDAMPSRGTLSISTKTIEGGAVSSRFANVTRDRVTRQYVQIEVADTGIGMDESTRQRIFEPFFTTKGPGKGTGLGLAVVFGIVEHHSGFIDVRSAPGEGATFTVYLPVRELPAAELQPASKSLEEIPGGTETILIIEDEEMLKELVKVFLVSKGYTVLTAKDGMQGVEMYQSHQKEIAVVLSDMGLPILSGQDVFRKIREINPEAKVIFASGFFDPQMRSEMYKAGLKEFIQKPYMQDEVLQKIREAIDTNG